jgi:hypothetical protein
MKKNRTWIAVLCLFAFSFLSGQQEKAEEKSDPLKNFSLVKDIQPAPEKVKTGLKSITGKDAVAYLRFISSDLLEGRDTASAGYDIAALYAATLFDKWGIQPAGDPERRSMDFRMLMRGAEQAPRKAKRSYFQNIAFKETISTDGVAMISWQKGQQKKTRTFHPNKDYSYSASETQSLSAPVVFVGYGIQEPKLKFDEYKNLDVKGKFVMMLSETPGKDDPDSPFSKGELREKYYPQARRMMRRMSSPKVDLARKLGAVGILMVENSPKENSDVARRVLDGQRINDERPIIPGPRRRISLIDQIDMGPMRTSIPTIRISRDMADDILGLNGKNINTLKKAIEEKLQGQSMLLSGTTFTVKNTAETKLVNSMNVLGYIEGTDPELKNEAIVIGAHLDHLGRRGDYIFNGADDDGSGSVGVMEIAEAFAKNPVKPKRSVVFALWTGEEKGLLGSRYYVANPFIAKTAVNLNLDMISRTYNKDRLAMMARRWGAEIDKEVLEKLDVNRFVNLSFDANTPEIGEIMRKNNSFVGLHIHIQPSEGATGGSDHAPFAYSKIPWAFFIAAMTEDYHQPSDTVDKVSSDLMEKIIRLTYLAAFDLADK